MEALRDLSSPRALVIRDGEQIRIPGREVVGGDIVVLVEGDRVPADSVLIACTNLAADESMLTGESVPVRKTSVPEPAVQMGRPGGDDLPFVFSGTLVVQGKGLAKVLATGMNTEIGRIGKALKSIEQEPTRVQNEAARMVKALAWSGFALALLVAVWYGVTRSDWLNGLLAGITLAMAILPEELPVVLTIFLGLGAWRISKKRVLTRHIPAVEMLGSATVLCVDKTGTLTLNRMALSKLVADGELIDLNAPEHGRLPERFHELLEFSVLSSHRDPFDPMERAIREAGVAMLADTEHWHENWTLIDEYPLAPGLLAMSRVWESPDRAQYVIAAKGALEAIVDLCHLSSDEAQALSRQGNAIAEQGLRVLGVAKAHFAAGALPGAQHDFEFRLLGLIGLVDPVRSGVPAAVKECHQAGIRVVMITGDYPATATSIGSEIGLPNPERIITGPELDALSDEELQKRIRQAGVFCRVTPEQKLRIVGALKANGEIVAMTGDGVNDAPALKAAHIGVAMGGRGTDVARESAALVLLDDDFSSIVEAVKLGRRIFDNLRKAIAFVIAVHVPIVGLSLIPVAMGWPLILLPVHILFLQLIIDPACSLVFEAEPEEPDVMQRPPRPPSAPLFDRHTVALGLIQGVVLLAIVVTIFGVALYQNQGVEQARALTFTTLILANLGLIFSNRSRARPIREILRTPNPALWWVIGGALVFLTLVLAVPILRKVFRFADLHAVDVGICAVAGAISLLGFEVTRRIALKGVRPSN